MEEIFETELNQVQDKFSGKADEGVIAESDDVVGEPRVENLPDFGLQGQILKNSL